MGGVIMATVLSDVALIIGALAALVAAFAGVIAVVRGRRMEATWKDMAVKVEGIDHAVNNVGPGEPTLRETVERHSGEIAAIDTKLTDGFAAVYERLDQMAADAARHHPEE